MALYCLVVKAQSLLEVITVILPMSRQPHLDWPFIISNHKDGSFKCGHMLLTNIYKKTVTTVSIIHYSIYKLHSTCHCHEPVMYVIPRIAIKISVRERQRDGI